MQLFYDGIDQPGLNTLRVYRGERGGYEMLSKAQGMDPADVLAELQASGVRGRGGAGFSMGTKASFLPKGDMDKYVVCNADESEPGTFKDRELMQKNPHLLIEGLAIAAYAVGANKAFIFIRGEYDYVADILETSLAEAKAAGVIGPLNLWIHRGAGAYICGEETALLDALEGKRGNPRLKPPFPAVQGLYRGPTLINNVETLMNAPIIMRMGGAEYAKIGTERFDVVFTKANKRETRIGGDFDADFDYEYVDGHPNLELVFLYRPDRVVIEADLLFNLPATEQYSRVPEAERNRSGGLLERVFLGAQGKKGEEPTWVRRANWYLSKDRASLTESVKRIAAWDFDTVVPCHGDTLEGDGKDVFVNVFKWHIEGKH